MVHTLQIKIFRAVANASYKFSYAVWIWRLSMIKASIACAFNWHRCRLQAENVAKRIHKAVNQLVMGDQKLNEKFYSFGWCCRNGR